MLLDGRAAGELIVEQEALYTWFDARCRLPEEGRLWCAWAVGEKDSLRLGVLEPSGQEAVIRRRFSRRMTERDVAGRTGRGDAVSCSLAAKAAAGYRRGAGPD